MNAARLVDTRDGPCKRAENDAYSELTVGRSGVVESARVIAAEPAGLFEEAALEAVSQWKYSPRVENGLAVSQPGIRTTIVFELRDDRS